MKGTMLIISQDKTQNKLINLTRPDSDEFHKAVGGWLELVPYFNTIVWDGKLHDCIAFCDEEGKIKGKPTNFPATILWKLAQGRVNREVDDFLVGNICVVFGDEEFMEEM
jgi:hypothetical protein